MRKLWLTCFVLAATLTLSVAAHALPTFDTLDDFTKAPGGLVDGGFIQQASFPGSPAIWEASGLYKETQRWRPLNMGVEGESSGIITNPYVSGFLREDYREVTLSKAVFEDVINYKFDKVVDGDPNRVKIFEVIKPFTAGTFDILEGFLLLGFNDYHSVDTDFDDLIVVAKPTPIPGAVWLLGTGLLGVAGLRRRFSS